MPTRPDRFPYRVARQRHIGEALGALEARGLVGDWHLKFDYPPDASRWQIRNGRADVLAWWTITDPVDGSQATHATREAEEYILRLCAHRGIQWQPVPRPGGESMARPVRKELASQADAGEDVLGYSDAELEETGR